MMHMQSCAGNPSRIPVTLCCKTVGHSSLKINEFIAHIRARGVNRIADVRSTPYSRYAPQFNRETLAADLQLADIAYEYLGSSLGGRPRRPDVLFPDGTVDFDKVRELPAFQEGILQLIDEIHKGEAVALMCAEKDPYNCHRFLLVSRELAERGVLVEHIISAAATVSQRKLEDRLIEKYCAARSQLSLFEAPRPRQALLAEAYRLRNRDFSAAPSRGKS